MKTALSLQHVTKVMRCSAEWLLAREGEPSYRIFIVAGLRLLLNAIAFTNGSMTYIVSVLEIILSFQERSFHLFM